MENWNQSTVTEFIFLGLTDDPNLEILLFLVILLVYIFTLVWNIGIFMVIVLVSKLHTPMYFFLSILSLSDFCYASVTAPKMLKDLFSEKKSISYFGCATQTFFFLLFASVEIYLLSAMAYDRYAAICRPLRYPIIVNRSMCTELVSVVYMSGIITAAAPTGSIFSASFCGSNVIDHFYCDLYPLIMLACSDTFIIEAVIFSEAIFFGLGSLMITITSYIYILSTILQIPSHAGRLKAFSTCGSHLTALSLFYGTVIFMYLRMPGSGSVAQDKAVSVCYTILIPMLNPLIYSLRNQEVKRVIRTIMQKKC